MLFVYFVWAKYIPVYYVVCFVIIMSIYKCLSNTHLNLIIIKLDEQVERPKTIASFIIDRLLMYLNVCGVWSIAKSSTKDDVFVEDW